MLPGLTDFAHANQTKLRPLSSTLRTHIQGGQCPRGFTLETMFKLVSPSGMGGLKNVMTTNSLSQQLFLLERTHCTGKVSGKAP